MNVGELIVVGDIRRNLRIVKLMLVSRANDIVGGEGEM